MSSDKNHHIAKVTGLAVMDRRLFYLDPKYEKVARVDAADGSGEVPLITNEVGLRSLNIFRKRQRPANHPCIKNLGGCSQICIPHKNSNTRR